MAWYNYTRRDVATYAGILLSRNGTKSGRYMILACDVTPGVRSVVCGHGIFIGKYTVNTLQNTLCMFVSLKMLQL